MLGKDPHREVSPDVALSFGFVANSVEMRSRC
jgi:hypothetical protein